MHLALTRSIEHGHRRRTSFTVRSEALRRWIGVLVIAIVGIVGAGRAYAVTMTLQSPGPLAPGGHFAGYVGTISGLPQGVYRLVVTQTGTFTLDNLGHSWLAANGQLFGVSAPTFVQTPSTTIIGGGGVPMGTPAGASVCVQMKLFNLSGAQLASAQYCITVPAAVDSISVPQHVAMKFTDQSVTVTVRVVNGGANLHTYDLAFVPVAGQGGPAGTPCGVAGPTGFSVQGGLPTFFGLAPGRSRDFVVTIARPPGLTAADLESCYDVVLHNWAYQSSVTARGSVRDARSVVTSMRGGLGGAQFAPVRTAVGSTFAFQFGVESTGFDPTIGPTLRYEVRATSTGGGAAPGVSLGDAPPGAVLRGEIPVPVGSTAEIPVAAFVAQLPVPAFTNYELWLDQRMDGNFLPVLTIVGEAVIQPASDFNGDGSVDGFDLGMLLGAWGQGDSSADLDGNGTVDGADLGLLLGSWTP